MGIHYEVWIGIGRDFFGFEKNVLEYALRQALSHASLQA